MLSQTFLLPASVLVVCMLRWLSGFERRTGDASLLLLFVIVRSISSLFGGILHFISNNYIRVLFMVSLILLSRLTFYSRPTSRSASQKEELDPQKTSLKPLIFPCRTTHTRYYPQKHTFTYSYLQVGIPIDWSGSVASMVAANPPGEGDLPKWAMPQACFTISASNHLDRGNAYLGLRGKLNNYLKSQGEVPDRYPHVYLVTAPTFLGYSFNPVSFWYLYSSKLHLIAMILEVNNTFDERRMYFLKGSRLSHVNGDISGITDSHLLFKDSWEKDFHVSPFNDRQGHYTVSAKDPLSSSRDGLLISNQIHLGPRDGTTKLIASLRSIEKSIDPLHMSRAAKARFIFAWWWVGFATFPRILKEAAKIFFLRRLKVWYRPEVVNTSIGRTETRRERVIEHSFREYLRQASSSQSFEYIAAGKCRSQSEIISPTTVPLQSSQRFGLLHVLTPLFYAQLVLSSDPLEYIASQPQQPKERQTLFLRDLEPILAHLGQEVAHSSSEMEPWITALRWKFISSLRRKAFRKHSLDQFVRVFEPRNIADEYQRAVIVLLISNMFLAGYDGLLDFLWTAFRVGASYASIDLMSRGWQHSDRELNYLEYLELAFGFFHVLLALYQVVGCFGRSRSS